MFRKIDINFLKELRNIFSNVTGLYITFIDPYGNFIIPEIGKRKFCIYLRKLKLNKECDISNSMWVKRAVDTKKPCIYQCPFGLTEMVVPIIVEKKCIGAVITGQVRIETDKLKIPFGVNITADKYLKIKQLYEKVPLVTIQTMNAAKNFLFHIINYIFTIDFESFRSKFVTSENLNKFNKKLVQNAKNYISSHISDKKVTLSKISMNFGVPPYYLSHLFRELTGHSLSHYITLQKLKKAAELLKNPSISIKKIVQDCGFYDEYYFNKIFKKEYGISPGEFRKNLLK